MSIDSAIEFIKDSYILPTNIFVLPDTDKQDEYLIEFLLEKQVMYPVCVWNFVDYDDLKASLYFPQKTPDLLNTYDTQTIKVLDAIYFLVHKRRSLVTVRVVDYELLKSFSGVFASDALFSIKFNDYNMLPERIREQIKPIDPEVYITAMQN